MGPDELDKLERQRRDADQRYNAALTAFDSALLRTAPPQPAALVVEPSGRPVRDSWGGWSVRSLLRWLAPWIDRQDAFNARTATIIETLIERDRDRTASFEQFQSTLIRLLQQITAFVETKDRHLAAIAAGRLDEHQRMLEQQRPTLETIPELGARIAIVQRAVGMLTRRLDEAAPAGAPRPPLPVVTGSPREPTAAPEDSSDDYKYVGFEDQFRGSDESVAAKLAEYLPIFAGTADVVDLGCGRGEFLMTLKAAGISGRGIDTIVEMVAVAKERGLDVTVADALGYVKALADESIGGLIATQVVEHLTASYLIRLLDSAHRALRPGAPIVLETINPKCWYAFFSSYTRDLTHVHPVHPETLQYLLRASGFERVEIRYREPVPDTMKLKANNVAEDVRVSDEPLAKAIAGVARTLDTNAEILNNLIFTYMDYAVVGYRAS